MNLTNYTVAFSRVAVAVLFVPLLWGVASLIVFEPTETMGMAAKVGIPIAFLLFGFLFIWTATRVVLWVRLTDDQIIVRWLLKRRSYSYGMVKNAVYTRVWSTISEVSHKFLIISFVTNEKAVLKVSKELAAEALRKLYNPDDVGPRSGERRY